MSSRLRILAVTRKPASTSFQQRVLRWVGPLADRGVDVEWRTLPNPVFAQRRFLIETSDFDIVWWHRFLLSPWLTPPLRRAARRVVFDFDDPPIFSARHRPSVTRRVRFARLLSRCDATIPATHTLAELARPYCGRMFMVPNAIDIPESAAPNRTTPPYELLWLGSPATQPFLELIRPGLERLSRMRDDVRLRLVGDRPMAFDRLPVDFRPWSPHEQHRALRQCHIGLCPMPDTPWAKCRRPRKVLHYMAYAMPWVGSTLDESMLASRGEDDSGATGICCASDAEGWATSISDLLNDADRRDAMGAAGRACVQRHNSVRVVADLLAEVFTTTANGT